MEPLESNVDAMLLHQALSARRSRLRATLAQTIIRSVVCEVQELCAIEQDRLAREGLLSSDRRPAGR